MKRITQRLCSETGFTLIELIVVATLLAVMSSLLYGTLNGIMRGRNMMIAELSAHRAATHVIDRLNRELTNRVAETLVGDENADDRNTASPYQVSSRVNFEGTNNKIGQIDADIIRFISDASAQEVLGGGGNVGRVQITYRLEADPERLKSISGEDMLPGMVLVREEVPAGVKDSSVRNADRVIFPIARDIVGLNFKFLQKDQWQDSWQRRAGFPDAIEVQLKLRTENGEDRSFKTAITMRHAKSAGRSPYEALTGGAN